MKDGKLQSNQLNIPSVLKFQKRCLLLSSRVLICAIILTLGCSEPIVETYTIAKEAPDEKLIPVVQNQKMQALPGMEAYTKSAPSLQYETPLGWNELKPTSIRKANFSIKNNLGEAEISVTVFPGDVGGLLANINRWRNQIGLQTVEASNLNTLIEPLEISKNLGYFTKLNGNKQSILGGILPLNDATWFIKMQGSILCVDAETENFKGFLLSIVIKDEHN